MKDDAGIKENKKAKNFEDEIFFIKKLLEKNGYKFTKQKRIILKELFNADKHLNAKEIYEKLKQNNIGLATVYRTMKLFNDLGIVKEIEIEGENYYELKIFGKKPLHIHFRCIKCRDIIDVDESRVALEYLHLTKILENINGFDVYDVDIMFSGICKRCKEVLKNSTNKN